MGQCSTLKAEDGLRMGMVGDDIDIAAIVILRLFRLGVDPECDHGALMGEVMLEVADFPRGRTTEQLDGLIVMICDAYRSKPIRDVLMKAVSGH